MNPAIPYVVLGAFITGCLCFYIGGCASQNNWWPMMSTIPAAVTIFCGVMFKATSEGGSCEGGCVSNDGWLFGLVASITSMIALPIVFFHMKFLNGTSLALHLIGDACTGIGFIVFAILQRRQQRDDGFF